MTAERACRDSLLVFAACVVAYWLLRQDTVYGVDAWNDLRRLSHGDTRSPIPMEIIAPPVAGPQVSV